MSVAEELSGTQGLLTLTIITTLSAQEGEELKRLQKSSENAPLKSDALRKLLFLKNKATMLNVDDIYYNFVVNSLSGTGAIGIKQIPIIIPIPLNDDFLHGVLSYQKSVSKAYEIGDDSRAFQRRADATATLGIKVSDSNTVTRNLIRVLEVWADKAYFNNAVAVKLNVLTEKIIVLDSLVQSYNYAINPYTSEIDLSIALQLITDLKVRTVESNVTQVVNSAAEIA